MTLRSSDLQSDIDLDSIRNSCDVCRLWSETPGIFWNLGCIIAILKLLRGIPLLQWTGRMLVLWVEGEAGSDACVCVWTAGTFGSSRYGRTNYGGKFVKFIFLIYIQGVFLLVRPKKGSDYKRQKPPCIWVILRCWGNSSMVCQQNSDAL